MSPSAVEESNAAGTVKIIRVIEEGNAGDDTEEALVQNGKKRKAGNDLEDIILYSDNYS
jgi:hypothetical protein